MWMSIKDAARSCKVSSETVRRWSHEHPKLGARVAGKISLDAEEIEAIASGHEAGLWTFSKAAGYFSRKIGPHLRDRLRSPNFAEIVRPAVMLGGAIYDEIQEAFPAVANKPWLPIIPKEWVNSQVKKYLPVAQKLPR